MSAKNPQNGATFTKGKRIKGPRRPPDPGRKAGQIAADRIDAAKSRAFNKRVTKDGLFGALFPEHKKPPPEPMKRRRKL